VSEPDSTPPNLRADAFAGAAEDYARYRLPYPAALLSDLTRRAGLSGHGRLLDLACGPGRVALALAGMFREVDAVDLEPEMIAEARRQAGQRGVSKVRWSVGRAEDFEASAGSYELVTVGEAFHRLDQQRVAAKVSPGWRPAARWR
jgi:2-polyprenyl-3-methyl-5-hydroxy-6-metoxy-1,4-benzoquinol methylase